LQQGLLVEFRLGPDQLVVDGLEQAGLAVGERIGWRIDDGVVAIAAHAV
jgi:hypothetical protein